MARFPPVEKGGKGTDISWSKGTVGTEKVGEIVGERRWEKYSGGPRVVLVIVVLLVI